MIFYINLFVQLLGVPSILQYDNGSKDQGALLLFLNKHNIKLINSHPQTLQTQRLIEQANAFVKDKIVKWQAVNGTGDWADSLTAICDSMNNQTHESLPTGITAMQTMSL